jgi:hypothetical protein
MWQARHRAFFVALVNLPWKLRRSSEFNLNSGLLYLLSRREYSIYNSGGVSRRNLAGDESASCLILETLIVNLSVEHLNRRSAC